MPEDGWGEWSKYVLKGLQACERRHEDLEKTVHDHTVEIAKLKLKAGLIGSAAGAGGALIVAYAKGLL